MPQRPLPERQKRDLHFGRIPPRQDGQVGALEMRCGADGGQDVGGQRQVQHLLLDDVDEGGLPGLNTVQLLRRQALAGRAFERELCVQVFAHQAMLKLAGLAEEVDKLFPALGLQRRLSSHRDLHSWPSRAWRQETGCNTPDLPLRACPAASPPSSPGAQLRTPRCPASCPPAARPCLAADSRRT